MKQSTSELSDQEIGDLLTDPACPSARVLGRTTDVAIKVEDAVAFVARERPSATDVETQLTAYVKRVGGDRTRASSLNDLPRRIVGWALRKPRESTVLDLYMIPAKVFAERGRKPREVRLPE